jgi:hypothetical protein
MVDRISKELGRGPSWRVLRYRIGLGKFNNNNNKPKKNNNTKLYHVIGYTHFIRC